MPGRITSGGGRRGVAVVSVTAILWLAGTTARPAQGAHHHYQPATLAHCLSSHSVTAGVISYAHPDPAYRGRLPRGLASSVVFLPGFGPKIDGGSLYIFHTSALAKAGLAKLIATFVLLKGLSTTLGAISQKPPSLEAARRLARTEENVVLIWDYPRHHVTVSNRIVNGCLARPSSK